MFICLIVTFRCTPYLFFFAIIIIDHALLFTRHGGRYLEFGLRSKLTNSSYRRFIRRWVAGPYWPILIASDGRYAHCSLCARHQAVASSCNPPMTRPTTRHLVIILLLLYFALRSRVIFWLFSFFLSFRRDTCPSLHAWFAFGVVDRVLSLLNV